jgi:hypothetical protein
MGLQRSAAKTAAHLSLAFQLQDVLLSFDGWLGQGGGLGVNTSYMVACMPSTRARMLTQRRAHSNLNTPVIKQAS